MKIKQIGFVVFCGLAFNATGQEFNLSTLDGSNGYVINGESEFDIFGGSVSYAGDVNADGIDDIIIGAKLAEPLGGENYGVSYVVFGTANGMNSPLVPSDLNGINGFRIVGIQNNDLSGNSVSHAGDVNGDGVDDIIIGAPLVDANANENIGASYVVYGRSSGFPNSLNLSSLNGNNGFAINGINTGDTTGSSVSHAGDVNGDGVDDIIIGANYAEANGNIFAGISYVVFGDSNGFSSPLDLSSLDGSNGFLINGVSSLDFSGSSVSAAGDINNDGLDDIIIGASKASPDGNDEAGSSYVVFGNASGFSSILELSSLNGSNGFVINGISSGSYLGSSISAAGDVNDDGIDDIIIGAPGTNISKGASYIVFGSSSGFPSSFYPTALNGTNGFIINGIEASSGLGYSVSGAGDFNGDGISDIVIGTDHQSYSDTEGAYYVIYGSGSGFNSVLDLLSLDGTNGFIVKGVNNGRFASTSVSQAGDLDADGIGDIIVGSPETADTGVSYVIYGSDVIFASGFEGD